MIGHAEGSRGLEPTRATAVPLPKPALGLEGLEPPTKRL